MAPSILLMLTAKLFAALSIILAYLAFRNLAPTPRLDLYFHEAYFVVPPRLLHLVLSGIAAASALIYYVTSRWTVRGLTNSFGITHFVLTALALVLIELTATGFAITRVVNNQSFRALFLLYTGVAIFLTGYAIFAVKLAWTMLKIFRGIDISSPTAPPS